MSTTQHRLPRMLLAVGLVPAVLALPVVTRPQPAPHPVTGHVTAVALSGVDGAALTTLQRDARRAPAAARTGALDASLGRPEVLTGVRTAATFSGIGVTWLPTRGVAAPTVNVRVRQEGHWTRWETLETSDVGPDANTAEATSSTLRLGTEPLLTDPSDAYQVRVDAHGARLPRDLRVDLVDPGTSAADASLSPTAPASSAQAQTNAPSIITRKQWGADESIRECCPVYMPTIVAGFVHHTDTSNSYTAAGAAAQVRSIYLYHVKGNGWSDIGYNFLVDKFGRVFEGRYGGIDKAVKGAHTGGFNQNTFGVAALGTFTSTQPSSAMLAAIERVFAYKLDLYHRDPLSTTVLTSEGGGTSRYAAGVKVTRNVISGHRDMGYTSCPGNALYGKLPTIRSAVKSLMGDVTYSPASSSGYGYYAGQGPTVTFRPSRRLTWKVTVTDRCSGTVVRTFTGTSSTPVSVGWNLKSSTGAWVRPGAYLLTLTTAGGARPWASSFEVVPSATTPLSACATQRVGGSTLWDASVAAARATDASTKTVVVTAGGDLLDGMVAAPLAHSLGAVMLQTAPTGLPSVVRTEIVRRHATQAYVVGGTTAVGSAVDTELRGLGVTVTRLGGTTSAQTAALVAAAMPRHSSTAMVVPSSAPWDYAAAAGAAAATEQPVLFASGSTVPAETLAAIRSLGITATTLVATPTAVTDTAKAKLPVPTRVTGSSRYAIALAVADAYATKVGVARVSVTDVYAAQMAYTVVAAGAGNLVLLTIPTGLTSTTDAWIRAHQVTSARMYARHLELGTGILGAVQNAVAA